jgi:hypothetical protein
MNDAFARGNSEFSRADVVTELRLGDIGDSVGDDDPPGSFVGRARKANARLDEGPRGVMDPAILDMDVRNGIRPLTLGDPAQGGRRSQGRLRLHQGRIERLSGVLLICLNARAD